MDISLTIEKYGRVLPKEEECTEWEQHSTWVSYKKSKNSKEIAKQKLTFATRKPLHVYQHINISSIVYEDMISKRPPTGMKQSAWNKLTPKERLEYHLQQICDDLHGLSFTYDLLPE